MLGHQLSNETDRPGRMSALSRLSGKLVAERGWISEASKQTSRIRRTSNQDDALPWSEAVKLDQKLIEGLLDVHLISRASLPSNGVNLVEEDDRWCCLACRGEEFANATSSYADIPLRNEETPSASPAQGDAAAFRRQTFRQTRSQRH